MPVVAASVVTVAVQYINEQLPHPMLSVLEQKSNVVYECDCG